MYTIATLQEMFGFELSSVRIARRILWNLSVSLMKVTACLVKVILVIS